MKAVLPTVLSLKQPDVHMDTDECELETISRTYVTVHLHKIDFYRPQDVTELDH